MSGASAARSASARSCSTAASRSCSTARPRIRPGIEVSWTLVWLLGREGEVPLSEGYVTVVDAGQGELNASLEAGAALVGEETGAAQVRASFVVDAVDGALATEGDRVSCELEVGVEEWTGELRLGAAESS